MKLCARSPAYLQYTRVSATLQLCRWWLLKTTYKNSCDGNVSVIQTLGRPTQGITISKSALDSKPLSEQKWTPLNHVLGFYLFIYFVGGCCSPGCVWGLRGQCAGVSLSSHHVASGSWIPSVEPRPSGLATSALNHWSILLAPTPFLKWKRRTFEMDQCLKAFVMQAWWPEFHPPNPHKGRVRELTSQSRLLTCVPRYMCSTQTHTYIMCHHTYTYTQWK